MFYEQLEGHSKVKRVLQSSIKKVSSKSNDDGSPMFSSYHKMSVEDHFGIRGKSTTYEDSI
jgi:hypothetical protein